MSAYDRRITAARGDIAAASLQGKVEAQRFVEGRSVTICRGRIALHAAPQAQSAHETELLFGEVFTIYESKDDWSWGQAQSDRYVGYLHTIALHGVAEVPEARVTALMTPLLPAPDLKRPPLDMLPLNAQVKVLARDKGYARIAPDGYVFERHLAPVAQMASDWVAVAERFVGAPYVWGGKTYAGLDCSGLIQTALAAAGIASPRDTDMMEKSLGAATDTMGRERGDLIFWKGHMGVMLDAARLLHANAYHMEVAIEPLAEAVARIETAAGPVTSVRRL